MDTSGTRIPPGARWLGALGLLPFIGLAGASPFLDGAARIVAVQALVGYGAVILSFLGGAHWGMAIRDQDRAKPAQLTPRLVLSVVPSLIGWSALLLPRVAGLPVLAIAFLAMLWVDICSSRRGEAPPWYPSLRAPLTSVVVLALLGGAIT